MLRVAVSSAVNLPNVETIGKSDPYVVLTFQGLYLTCSWPVCSLNIFTARGFLLPEVGRARNSCF